MLYWNRLMAIGIGIVLAFFALNVFTLLYGISSQTVLASAPPIFVHVSDVFLVLGLVGIIIFSVGRFRRRAVPKIA